MKTLKFALKIFQIFLILKESCWKILIRFYLVALIDLDVLYKKTIETSNKLNFKDKLEILDFSLASRNSSFVLSTVTVKINLISSD